MYEEEPLMLVTGPRQGGISEMVRSQSHCRILLLSLYVIWHQPAFLFIVVSLVYTTQDYDLFQWDMSAISILAPTFEAKDIFFDVKMTFTGYLCGKEDKRHD
mmetsp:Transcript_16586/g.25785  ORF Transcript_16586/g.25785 Transcript_16586/m.25785 type:complete len:102 (+) Transcript_16586:666-971(+)